MAIILKNPGTIWAVEHHIVWDVTLQQQQTLKVLGEIKQLLDTKETTLNTLEKEGAAQKQQLAGQSNQLHQLQQCVTELTQANQQLLQEKSHLSGQLSIMQRSVTEV